VHKGPQPINDQWGEAIFFDILEPGTELHERMTNEPWTCLLLFDSIDQTRHFFILDWDDDVAKVVGHVILENRGYVPGRGWDHESQIRSLPSELKRIRLA
jgi:hypothetical protein